MDIKRAFDEANKRLRNIQEQLCCVVGNYNNLNPRTIDSGESYTFDIGTAHSITWELASGASVNINNGSVNANYSSNGSIEFSTLNSQAIIFTAVAGEVRVLSIN